VAGRQAKTITPAQLDVLLEHVRGRRDAITQEEFDKLKQQILAS